MTTTTTTTRRRRSASAETPTPKRENLSLLLALLSAEGLPAPIVQHHFHATRNWRLDLAWLDARGGGVACEVEGGVWIQGRHTRGSGFIADMEKYNELAIAGWMLVRVTYAMIGDGSAVTVIKRALESRAALPLRRAHVETVAPPKGYHRARANSRKAG